MEPDLSASVEAQKTIKVIANAFATIDELKKQIVELEKQLDDALTASSVDSARMEIDHEHTCPKCAKRFVPTNRDESKRLKSIRIKLSHDGYKRVNEDEEQTVSAVIAAFKENKALKMKIRLLEGELEATVTKSRSSSSSSDTRMVIDCEVKCAKCATRFAPTNRDESKRLKSIRIELPHDSCKRVNEVVHSVQDALAENRHLQRKNRGTWWTMNKI